MTSGILPAGLEEIATVVAFTAALKYSRSTRSGDVANRAATPGRPEMRTDLGSSGLVAAGAAPAPVGGR